MSGIIGVGTRSDEKSYCGNDNPESEAVCRVPESEIDASTLVCRSASSEALAPRPSPPATSSNDPVPTNSSAVRDRDPDYWTLSLGVGAVIGASATATLDRHGHVYL